jgi:hypothetical protein
LEGQLDELKERKRNLREAMVYQQILTLAEFSEIRIPLERVLAEAEDNLSQATLAETEIDAVLDFAEDLLLNGAGVWERCSLDQKQRLQQVLFPQGVEYADGIYRTQGTSFLFKGLEKVEAEKDVVGSATGSRGSSP